MRWLHLSDLHFNSGEPNYNSKLLRDKLLLFLDGKTVEHLFLTGDYRHAKFSSDIKVKEDAISSAEYIMNIAQIMKINPENIHYVPGNHDVTRSEETKKDIETIRKRYDSNKGGFTEDEIIKIKKRYDFFNEFRKALCEKGVVDVWENQLHTYENQLHTYRCYKDFNIIYLDTCILCDSDSDRGRLLLGTYYIDTIFNGIKKDNPDKPIIILAHHEFGNLESAERKFLEEKLRDNPVEFWLCGDAHEIWERNIFGFREITMGCLNYDQCVDMVVSIGEFTENNFKFNSYKWDTTMKDWDDYGLFNKRVNNEREKTQVEIITSSIPNQPSEFFVGRKEQLEEISVALTVQSKPILIYGMGGIGKSELCKKIFESCVKEGKGKYSYIGYLPYTSDLQNSAYGQFVGIEEFKTLKEYWQEVKSRIDREDMLLILDNVEGITSAELSELYYLKCKVIVTSREVLENVYSVETKSLSKKECNYLFRSISCDDWSSDEVIDNIVGMTACNTLAIELLAKTQRSSYKSATELENELKERGFQLPNIQVPIQYNEEYGKFIEHMSVVFTISKIDNDVEKVKILQMFSLISCNLDTSISDLEAMFSPVNLGKIRELVDESWLQQNGKTNETKILIHPIISEVIYKYVKPEREMYLLLMSNIGNLLHLEENEEFMNKSICYIHAEKFLEKRKEYMPFGIDEAIFLHNCAVISNKKAEYNKAYHELNQAWEISVREGNIDFQFTIRNTMAGNNLDRGEIDIAIEEFEKVREYFGGKCNYPYWIAATNNIGLAYMKRGNKSVAIKYFELVVMKSREIKGDEDTYTLTIYSNMAICYSYCKEYKKSLKCAEYVLKVREKKFGSNHLSTAYTYNTIASIYKGMGEISKSFEFYKKALKIREEKLGEEHPLTATVYHNIAEIYKKQGEVGEAYNYYKKALNIRSMLLGDDHIETASSYMHTAYMSAYLGDKEEAMQYYQKGYRIYCSYYGKNHEAALFCLKEINNLM